MNKEDIIRMAEEAGGFVGEMPRGDAWLFTEDEHLERFAKLIAEHEREACAKVCDDLDKMRGYSYADKCAAHIRARGQT